MRGRTRSVLVFLLLLSAQSRAETVCVDLGQVAHSTVSITRYFEDAERNPQSDVVAARGTAWFQSPTTLVTAAHVASGMKLSTQEWKSVSIKDGAEGRSNAVRMQRVVGSYAEKLAVLELQTAVPDARSVADPDVTANAGRSCGDHRLPERPLEHRCGSVCAIRGHWQTRGHRAS